MGGRDVDGQDVDSEQFDDDEDDGDRKQIEENANRNAESDWNAGGRIDKKSSKQAESGGSSTTPDSKAQYMFDLQIYYAI